MDQSMVRMILQASEQGEKPILQTVVVEGKLCVADDEGNTPLMYAASSGREEVLRMVLNEECLTTNHLDEDHLGGRKYIDVQNSYGWSALMQASSYGHSGSVALLLQRGADMHMLNLWGASALVLASQGGHFTVVNTLINHKAKVDLPYEGGGGELLSRTLTPLMAAAQCGHVEVVRELLRGGAKLEVKLKATKWTALMLASLNNQVGTVELLLNSGAIKDSLDIEGKTAADLARSLGHQNVVTLLTGGTIKINSDGEFLEAVSKGDVSKVTDMLQMKPTLASTGDKGGATPLMVASNKGHREVCDVLLNFKADVNIKDKKYGWTAVMHATHNKKYEVVELLGQHKADVNIRDNNGCTAYDIASMKGDIKMIKLIANITVERLQDKATPTTATPTTTTPTAPPSEDIAPKYATPTSLPKVVKPPNSINLMELRSRLQTAYQTPTPPPDIGVLDINGGGSVPTPRFPSARVRNPLSNSSGSTSNNTSPSSSSSNDPRHYRGSSDQFPIKQHHSSPSGNNRIISPRNMPRHPFPGAKATPPPGQNHPLISPNMSSRPPFPGGNKPSPLKFSPSPVMLSNSDVLKQKYRIGNPYNRSSSSGGGGGMNSDLFKVKPIRNAGELHKKQGSSEARASGGARRRANTESHDRPGKRSPAAPIRQMSAGGNLKTVLEQASLQHYYSIFQEQEVDYQSFGSLCNEDLCEMGITSSPDRNQLITLIHQCNTQGRVASMDTDVFVFQ